MRRHAVKFVSLKNFTEGVIENQTTRFHSSDSCFVFNTEMPFNGSDAIERMINFFAETRQISNCIA
jgi:hypothetical protein